MAQPGMTHKDYTVGWICALEVEQAVARALLEQEHPRLPSKPGDLNRYRFGSIAGHNVVIACLPDGEMGNNPATAVATRMISNYPSLKFGLMVGIGGGAPTPPRYDDVRLGDVVVSSATNQSGGVEQYDRGKTVQDGAFQRTGVLNRPPEVLRQAVADLRATHRLGRGRLKEYLDQLLSAYDGFASPATTQGLQDVLFKAEYDHPKGPGFPTCVSCDATQRVLRSDRTSDPVVHYGVIASGNQVMKNGRERDRISREIGGVLCFEMEAAGLMNTFPCIVIRGICDYSDSHKNKEWQAYAAAVAAAYAKELLSEIEPSRVDSTASVVDAITTSVDPAFALPFVRDVNFVGRRDILDGIEKRLQVGRRIALAGLGGIGKSQIAIEYAYRFREKHPQSHVLWVYGASKARFDQAYAITASKLNIPGKDDPAVNKTNLVLDWLSDSSHGRWLMILDNADEQFLYFPKVDASTTYDSNVTSSLADYLPLSSIEHGSLIITTRNKNLGRDLADGEEPIDVKPFSLEEAELLLEPKVAKNHWNVKTARELLEVLGYIPLAISQAAAFMKQNRLSMEKYLKAVTQSDLSLSQHLSTELLDPRRQRGVPSSVFLTWKLSFDQLSKEEPPAAQLLSLMAYLDGQAIPDILLGQKEHLGVEERTAIGTLLAFSMITAERNDETYSMHRLVQLSTQTWLGLQNVQHEWQETALELLEEKFPNGEPENWKTCKALRPHAIAVLNYTLSSDSNLLLRASILHNLAWFDMAQGSYKSATRYCKESYYEKVRILGRDDLSTLHSTALLASIYWIDGLWTEAEALELHVIEARKRVLGPEHPDTLRSVINLASTYREQGRLEEAEVLELQVIEVRKRVLGPEHPDTLRSVNNLAVTYQRQGRLEEAEMLDLQVMEAQKRVLGPEHPNTLISMNNLASTYHRQGRLEEAEVLELQVMEARKRVLGPEHPDTLDSMNNLASTYWRQGRLEEAEVLELQVTEARKRVLGPEHPDTLLSAINLASTYWRQGRLEEAEALEKQVTEVRKRILGPEHPDTLGSMHNLAYSIYNQNRKDEATRLMDQTVKSRIEKLGLDHPDTLVSLSTLNQWMAAI